MHSSYYDDKYRDYNPDSFVIQAKRTVYKWWCVVYKPVYKLTHEGRWPEYKEPRNVYPTRIPEASPMEMSDLAEQAMTAAENAPESPSAESQASNVSDADTLDKANEIMARLAREAAEDEAKKQAEIDVAREQAKEKETLDKIMLANKVDISTFIEEGMANRVE